MDFSEANGWQPCIVNIYSFTSAFIFSLETQHTIGYGVRSITEECPEAIFILCLQSSTGVLMQALMVGVVFAKITRSKNRSQTLLFSRHCVINRRNGELCLMFQIGDMRKSRIIGASVRAQLISKQVTDEGEQLATHQSELSLETEEGGGSSLFFIWPTVVVHRIGRTSPLYEVSATDLMYGLAFEIVVVLEGTIESTGQTTQARSSYLNTEILWGHRFEPIVKYNKDTRGYSIDYSKFDHTQFVSTSTCSAKELDDDLDKEIVPSDGNFFDFSTNTLLEHQQLPKGHVMTIEEDDEFVMNYYAMSRHSLPHKMGARLVKTHEMDTESAHTQG
jgi:potassium inwardly-rectifying channel subfamily J, other